MNLRFNLCTAWSIWRSFVDYKWLVVVSQAPDLFSTNHAAAALDMVEAHLVGPLGMKTLDNR